ncbi:hypothetical protein FRC96_06775 [Lujinxingia vulgaris]|uniref:Uncharacterized protein n=1 Tax=Lujinxingia vulgaris TaxID=2600176 RepID=A0A5C6XI83_9DELT|nr:hypothetical protein [Lujinxingia vulgaris]TXD39624.1 hypothetical protein FRC96_06775 [Lujinxingia vulgaris]
MRALPPTTLALAFTLLAISACGSTHETPPPIRVDEPDVAPDSPDTGNSPDTEEEFIKPVGPEFYQEGLEEIYECEDPTCNDALQHSAQSSRPHIATVPFNREMMLYEGEYVVIDSATVQSDRYFWLPGEFQVVALHEGRPLPIRYIEVEGPSFPSMEEIESWPESDYSTVQTIYREPYTYFNSTFVIPPWAFPEKGTYNVQLLVLPVWQPAEDQRFFFEGGAAYHRTYTIYYGSYFFYPHAEVEDRQNEAVVWENTAAGGYVGELDYAFLAPPTDIFDWTQWSWMNPIPAGHLTRAFDSPRREVMFDFFTINGEIMDTYTTGQNLYYVLRNEEVIDMFLLEPPSMPPLVDGWVIYDWERDRGFRLPLTVELTEEYASYKVVVVPDPFKRQARLHTAKGQIPVVSNALLMRYAPEE